MLDLLWTSWTRVRRNKMSLRLEHHVLSHSSSLFLSISLRYFFSSSFCFFIYYSYRSGFPCFLYKKMYSWWQGIQIPSFHIYLHNIIPWQFFYFWKLSQNLLLSRECCLHQCSLHHLSLGDLTCNPYVNPNESFKLKCAWSFPLPHPEGL